MDIVFFDETDKLTDTHYAFIEDLIKKSAKKINISDNFEISIILTTDDEIKKINYKYRNINKETDVISFALEDNTTLEDENFPVLNFENFDEEIPRLLGDIFISIDRTVDQAETYGHSFERELGFLVVHGFLHLNGYDHQTDNEKKEMFAIQEQILEESNLER